MLFRLPDAAFRALLGWLAPMRQSLLRTELFRRLGLLAFITLVIAYANPVGARAVLTIAGPLVALRGLLLLFSPHHFHFLLSASAFALLGGLEVYAQYQYAPDWIRWMQTTICAGLAVSDLMVFSMFQSNLRPRKTAATP
jgi:hypothetical protein